MINKACKFDYSVLDFVFVFAYFIDMYSENLSLFSFYNEMKLLALNNSSTFSTLQVQVCLSSFLSRKRRRSYKRKTQSNFCRFLIQRLSICQNVLCSYSGQLLLQLTQSVLSFHGFVLSSKLNSKGISDVNISIYKFSLVVRFCSFE